MPEPSASRVPSLSQAQARLQELAKSLREARHLDPRTRGALAGLLDELGRDLQPAGLPPEEVAHLTETAAQLVEALRRPQEAGLLSAARDGLESTVYRFEIEAPVTAGLLRRLIDALGSIGV